MKSYRSLQKPKEVLTLSPIIVFRRWDTIGWVLQGLARPSEAEQLAKDLDCWVERGDELLLGMQFGLRRPGDRPPEYRASEIFPTNDLIREVA
jgi:hypothetical protein